MQLSIHRLKIPVVYYVHSIDWELTSKSVKRFRRIVHAFTKMLVRFFYYKVKLIIGTSSMRQI